MQSLWQHANFRLLQSEGGNAIDLKTANLHEEQRLKKLTLSSPYWTLYLAHQNFSLDAFRQLTLLALNRQALNWMHAMQKGELVNSLEIDNPAFGALHTALRAQTDEGMLDLAKKVWAQAHEQRRRMASFLESHQEFETLLVLGIGGSQLGPDALYEALKSACPSYRRVIFIPNVDPQAHAQWARELRLEKTLVAAISKSGSTLETAQSEQWWRGELERKGLIAKDHMVCITTPGSKLDRVDDFASCFYFDSSIGGRYSATSSVGVLPLAFAFGMPIVDQLLLGASQMDAHALSSDKDNNAPLAMACVAIWQRQVCARSSQAVIPYRQGLHRFAAHLQQLEMESLGKSTDREGKPLEGPSGALIMGEPGTCAQHSFFQWLHQGTDGVPVDFIVETHPQLKRADEEAMADQLLANALAQSLALAKGHQAAHPHQSCPGGRSSSIIACEELTPAALGALLALYEHKTAFEGFIMGINPFDQEGVELGKRMARELYDQVREYRASSLCDALGKKSSPAYWWQSLVQRDKE